ncbi:MAG: hypothetical protein F6K35_42170, partial [Okeania sp. SIO2H7]|nr:hypothetical protein [Okeania sp. SIO2H7]
MSGRATPARKLAVRGQATLPLSKPCRATPTGEQSQTSNFRSPCVSPEEEKTIFLSKSMFCSDTEPFLPGTEPFLPGTEPFLPGTEPFLPGTEPFLPGTEPFLPG